MARVTKGNQLGSRKLQPGWTIEDDGFGLLTVRATYVVSADTEYGASGSSVLAASPKRGDEFENDPRLRCHRSSSTVNKNGLVVITAEFCGIATGNKTSPNVSGRGATTTEPIQRHPSFVSKIGGTSASPLNGAKFDGNDLLLGFGDTANKKYGLKSYYSPSFTITGHLYTTDITVASGLKDKQCCSSSSGSFAGINLLSSLNTLAPSWGTSVPYWMAADESPQLLLNNVSIEPFGVLYKVNYEVLVAVDGLDTDVYPYEGSGRPARA